MILQDFTAPLPSTASLALLDTDYPDQVPFLFAVTSGGTVNYFCLERVELPAYHTNI